MKLTIAREALIKPLQMVNGIVERRQTLPILSNIRLSVSDQTLSLVSTDLEIEMQTSVEAGKTQAGETTVPARKFLDICRSLADDAVIDLSVTGERATIRAGKSRFVLSTLPAREFPTIEVSRPLSQFAAAQSGLRDALSRTHFAMAQQDVRYYLNGMLLELKDRSLNLVATDGHRLALCELAVSSENKESQSIIVPRKAVQELLRLLADDETPAEIRLGGNFIQVNTAQMHFTSKLIDGRFPDYQNVIPAGGNKTAICEREGLRQALNRVSILSNEKYRGVRLQFSSNTLRLSAHNPEQEEAEEELAVDYSGDELEIGFNVTYLLEALSACRAEQVKLVLSDANSSCLLQGVGEKDAKHIVMPIRL
jgi:DNA polymerase-3 subunit beta